MDKLVVVVVFLICCDITLAEGQWLTMPFGREDAVGIKITEGWIYSDGEQEIHGVSNHKGLDFAAPYGTRVYAAADGLAVQSFHSRLLKRRLWQGKSVGFALGRFVQIWHPEHGYYTVYAHLSGVAPGILVLPSVQSEDQQHNWDPVGIYAPNGVIPENSTPIRRGDLIGYVGDSGLTWGYDETPDFRPNRVQFQSWDEPHVHFEVYTRGADGQKDLRFDPFAIYSDVSAYDMDAPPREGDLWLRDKDGHILLAR